MTSPRRSNQLRRTLLLIAVLRANGGCSFDRLARECGVSTRTIRRDLQALEEAGLPVYGESREHSLNLFWRFIKGSPCPICGKDVMSTSRPQRELVRSAQAMGRTS